MKKSTLTGLVLAAALTGMTASADTVYKINRDAMPKYTSPAVPHADDDDPVDGYPDFSGDTYANVGDGWGLYRDDMLNALLPVYVAEWDVEIQESQDHPGVYRIKAPYEYNPYDAKYTPSDVHDTYMYIDARDPEAVYMQKYYTGLTINTSYTDENGQPVEETTEVMINSMAGDYCQKYGFVSGLVSAQDENLVGKLLYGNITFPRRSMLVAEVPLNQNPAFDPLQTYTVANQQGLFSIKLPGALDLTASVSVGELQEKAEGGMSIPVSVLFTKDVEKARLTLVSGGYTNVTAEKMYKALIDGTCEYKEITYEQVENRQNFVSYDFNGTGEYTAYAVTFIEGKPAIRMYHSKELRNDTDWEALTSYAKYTECFLSDNRPITEGYFENWPKPETNDVIVEQSVNSGGLIRIVNPYTYEAPTYYSWTSSSEYDTDHFYYIYLDLTDPERVTLRGSDSGIGTNFSWMPGRINVNSFAYRYMTTGGPYVNEFDEYEGWRIFTPDEIAARDLFGKYDDEAKTVTFPAASLCVNFSANPTDSWYNANDHNTFLLQLPADFSAVEAVVAENDSVAPVYYNLQGVRVDNPAAGSVYIKKTGDKAVKVRL